ncbi:MAG: hypothetical protein A2W25_03280 [candidate division Zixibacteria bacterium RBG_16_53_22]|nr:MAG: hypothetical protein A2W25_03280 [candidate division Zixibacteria bacterium RBG_16_53_22]
MNAKAVILIILVVLAVVFMFQNKASMPVQILFWSIHIPRILLIFILILVGFTIGYVARDMKARKKSSE